MILSLSLMMTSILSIFVSHPLSLGLSLMSQTIMVAVITGMKSPNFWFSYILFLIMVGGMLVMFIYMTSIASNEKFKMPSVKSLLTLMMLMIFFSIMFNYKQVYNYMNTDMYLFPSQMKLSFHLSKFFQPHKMFVSVLMMIYLLVTLIASVKISKKNMGPLRQKT